MGRGVYNGPRLALLLRAVTMGCIIIELQLHKEIRPTGEEF